MNTLTATEARKRPYSLVDEVKESHEPMQIVGKRSSAVLISEEDWRAIQENYIIRQFQACANPPGRDLRHWQQSAMRILPGELAAHNTAFNKKTYNLGAPPISPLITP